MRTSLERTKLILDRQALLSPLSKLMASVGMARICGSALAGRTAIDAMDAVAAMLMAFVRMARIWGVAIGR